MKKELFGGFIVDEWEPYILREKSSFDEARKTIDVYANEAFDPEQRKERLVNGFGEYLVLNDDYDISKMGEFAEEALDYAIDLCAYNTQEWINAYEIFSKDLNGYEEAEAERNTIKNEIEKYAGKWDLLVGIKKILSGELNEDHQQNAHYTP